VGTDFSATAGGDHGVRIDGVSVESGTTVTGPSGPPVIKATAADLNFVENQVATTVDADLTVTDSDSPNLTGATVSISANFSPGEDALAFSNQGGITGVYDG
jgi:hypothetical protein